MSPTSPVPSLRAGTLALLASTLLAPALLFGGVASCGSGAKSHTVGSGGGDAGTGTAGSDGGSGVDAGDPCAIDTSVPGTTSLSAVWANEGGDKVTQDELRARASPSAVTNSVWDGHCIKVFGAQNEVVSFNLVLEAATGAASKVAVSLGDFTGPGGAVLRSGSRTKDQIFDWTTTEAELFYVRYLEIKGLSQQAYGTLAVWQEATFPKRAQCPGMMQATPDSKPTGAGCPWAQRPVANKLYPDIAVPLELVPTFAVAAA
jgi:hypothetical protein